MSYIITAEVQLDAEMNAGGDIQKVAAGLLSLREGLATFDVPGDFDPARQRQLVLQLCGSLVAAGFVEFRIGHSY